MSKHGERIRPCTVCKMPVNFVFWAEETERRKRRIFHWANPDGTHHVHKTVGQRIAHLMTIDDVSARLDQEANQHIQSIQREEF